MRDFNGAVAVITGGASGIGLGLAEAALLRGARVVIADIRADALAAAVDSLAKFGGEVLAVKTDVSKFSEVEALADAAIRRFGEVNLLFNNAGVFASGVTWETSVEEFDWVIGVNLRSVINGIKAFVPRMISQGDPCHVINTSSGAGLTVSPGFSSYSMTKHAVVALSEALYLDLATQGVANIGVTIVMPGVVQSKIMSPEKGVPARLQRELASRKSNPVLEALEQTMNAAVDAGMPVSELADIVFQSIQNNALYVLPNFADDISRKGAEAIAIGRCNGINPYPERLEAMRAFLEA